MVLAASKAGPSTPSSMDDLGANIWQIVSFVSATYKGKQKRYWCVVSVKEQCR